ncbi:MAG: NAD(P)/FAD-dependent oxidoreductase [Ilumatobacteraceae bacterium]
MSDSGERSEFDVVVVGAGMAGLYLLKRLREHGHVGGGTRGRRRRRRDLVLEPVPGCPLRRAEVSTTPTAGIRSWKRSGSGPRSATQPEILRYLQHVADKHDLRRDIRFETRVDAATWDDGAGRWRISTEAGDELVAQHYVMATGCLSVPKDADIPGADRFEGPTYYTGRWPHEGVDFTGRRVAVIGTGSSAIQSIPIIAEQAAQLTVFQRTANFWCRPTTDPPIPRSEPSTTPTRRPTGRRPVGRPPACRSNRPKSAHSRSATRSARPRTRQGGRKADCSASAVGSTTSSSTPPPTRPCPSSFATRSGRSSTIPRPPRRCAPPRSRCRPSDCASTPATTRPTTATTSGSSTCARPRSRRSPSRGSTSPRRTAPSTSSSTTSCSPSGSTR